MNFWEGILLKQGWRSDSIWTHPLLYSNTIKRLPFHFDTSALLKSQYWSRTQLDELSEQKLRALITQAASIPYWHTLFKLHNITPEQITFDTLACLPLLTKEILRALPHSEYTRISKKREYWHDHTSGSTGLPFDFFHDRQYELRLFAVCERTYITAARGAIPRPHLISMRPRFRRGVYLQNATFFYVRGYNSIAYRFDALRKLIQSRQEHIILHGFGTTLLHLAQHAKKHGVNFPLHSIVVSAEGLTSHQREYIEKNLHAPLFMTYSSRELGFLAFECEHKRLHCNEEWACIEIIDFSGARVPNGTRGRIVISMFENHVMPFIRYRTGDLGTLHDDPCPCGRTLKTITVEGREAALIELQGKTTSLIEVSGAFDRFFDAVRHYQIVQAGPLQFTIRVVPGPTFVQEQQDLHSALIRTLHPEAQISWEIVETIPETKGGKAAYFVRESW